MKVAAALYLDHQDVIGYPVELVLRSVEKHLVLDCIYLYGADVQNTAFLHGLSKRTVPCIVGNLDHKISDASDISVLMQRSFDRLKEEYDFIVLVQADTVANARAGVLIQGFTVPENLDKAAWLCCVNDRMYFDIGSGFGFTVMGRTCRSTFVGDGMFGGGYISAERPCLSVGYMGPDMCYRHTKQHALSYHSAVGLQECALYERDREAYIRYMLQWTLDRSPTKTLVPLVDTAPEYAQIIAELGLEEDYAHVMRIAAEEF